MSKEEEYNKILIDIKESMDSHISKLRSIVIDDPFSEYTPVFSMVLEGIVGVSDTIDLVSPKKEEDES